MKLFGFFAESIRGPAATVRLLFQKQGDGTLLVMDETLQQPFPIQPTKACCMRVVRSFRDRLDSTHMLDQTLYTWAPKVASDPPVTFPTTIGALLRTR